jgi:alkanesulfonate monooxygenase SsuD/methylene tetrahydromethanopterin reductase-like flavin-dependent oxidoreductase (luciferase family)|tara:strand:+ start:234 stop:1301 length:1068 start_codon:yes stop_codon:yes gene_type:complete
MDIGIGIDPTLGLTIEEELEVSKEAARLDYKSIWTPEGTGYDSFQTCLMRWQASKEIIDGGLYTGIAVSPIMWRTPVALSMSGGTVSNLSGGKFIMGIGAGSIYRPEVRKKMNLPKLSMLSLMRDYITIMKGLLAGDRVTHKSQTSTLEGIKLGISPPPKTPLFLGALGPKMLSLAGELADGVALNWCTPEQIQWSRDKINEGAKISNRNPDEISVSQYIRVCIDDDEAKARIGLAKATMHYALGSNIPNPSQRKYGYRAHFERMGFSQELLELDNMRKNGATNDEIAIAFPENILNSVGYYGKHNNAAKEFARLSKGLDKPIVRIVSATPGDMNSALNTIKACAPNKIKEHINA